MAVEARRLNNLFCPQLRPNGELMKPMEASGDVCNTTQIGYGVVPTAAETSLHLLPVHGGSFNNVAADSFPYHNSSSNSYNCYYDDVPLPTSRKRSRDFVETYPSSLLHQNPKSCAATPFSFLGQDMSLQIQQQQLDIDRLIAHHMERVKMEIDEKRKKQARTIMAAIEQGLVKKLRAKEEEREKIGKLNHALEERVKTLCIENQIWRDLAQTNEATANALRSNLEQVLAAQVKDEGTNVGAGLDEVADDAQSCCGSSWGEEEGRTLAEDVEDKGRGKGWNLGTSRKCRSCGEEESCVLLLPCRHLCLCAVCGSSLHTCPVCNSPKNASVHVNTSS